jgi:O-glycosyl hydrolase
MYAAYRDYVVAFAQRYQHRGVTHIIIWNEPNLQFEWGGQPPNPEAYAQLLATVYPAVKHTVPAITIIAGASSPGATLGDHAEVRLGDREYLTRFLAAGGGQFIDAWGVHAYGGQLPPDVSSPLGCSQFATCRTYPSITYQLCQ